MSHINHDRHKKTRRGFTLIELLVVIVIIGILGSLVFVGGRAAISAARRGIIKTEIAQVCMALESYKGTYGEYPPDFSDPNAVMRHVRKRWPNFNWFNQKQDFDGFCKLVEIATGYDFTTVKEHGVDKSRGAHIGALAFWLGGIPDERIGMLNGFSADVSNPLGLDDNGGSSKDPSFKIDNITQWDPKSQFMDLTLGNNCDIVDKLPVIIAYNYPIAYFKANASGKYLQKGADDDEPLCFHFHFSKSDWDVLGIGVPYAKSGSDAGEAVWHNPKSYQLIHPGLDGMFGIAEGNDLFKEFRVIDPNNDLLSGCTVEDHDNQANFGGVTIDSSGN